MYYVVSFWSFKSIVPIFRCSHKDLGVQPKYEFDEGDGPPHNRIFTCTATLPGYSDVNVTAVGSTKQNAKNEAACMLKPLIEALPDGPEAEAKRQRRLIRQQKQKGRHIFLSNVIGIILRDQ
jgi:hypothetical protein